MRKRTAKKLELHRETLRRLEIPALLRAAGAALDGTLTVEPPCERTALCPPDTGCTSATLSCTL